MLPEVTDSPLLPTLLVVSVELPALLSGRLEMLDCKSEWISATLPTWHHLLQLSQLLLDLLLSLVRLLVLDSVEFSTATKFEKRLNVLENLSGTFWRIYPACFI